MMMMLMMIDDNDHDDSDDDGCGHNVTMLLQSLISSNISSKYKDLTVYKLTLDIVFCNIHSF